MKRTPPPRRFQAAKTKRFQTQRSHRSALALGIALLLIQAITFQTLAIPVHGTPRGSSPTVREGFHGSARHIDSASLPDPRPLPPTQKLKPNAVQAAVIVATNRDSFPDHSNGGKAVQGDVINYSVAVTNTGDANATSVVFNDTVDPNTSTLVGGSPQILFTVTGDTYSDIGNVGIYTASITPSSGQFVTDHYAGANGAT